MKFEKKHWMMLVAGLVVLFLVYWFFFRKKKVAESSYNPAVPIWGISMGEPSESGYINCGQGQCEVKWDYWTDTNPPQHLSGSYCGSCSTGSPSKIGSVIMTKVESNYVAGGSGLCSISWTDEKGVKHVEEIPCSKLKGIAATKVTSVGSGSNAKQYKPGDRICDGGTVYVLDGGTWKSTGQGCDKKGVSQA